MIKNKKIYKYFLYFFLAYSLYCGITIGESWDEADLIIRGKNTFQYLLSLGKIKQNYIYDEFYSPSYWFFQFFLSQFFPLKFQTVSNHVINLLISLSAIIGFSKLTEELFNKLLGKIIFVILFFYPIFFGHMSINYKDPVITFCHVWIFYLTIRYLKNQFNIKKSNKYIYKIGILLAIGTGIQLLFIGTLLPVLILIFFEIFIFKKIIKKNFNINLLFVHFIKILLIFYFFLIFFWPAVHSDILSLPVKLFIESFTIPRGWEWNLLNGEILLSKNVSVFYFYINFFFKSPEYVLFNYILFILLIFYFINFFNKEFTNFIYKFLFLFSFLFMPALIISLSTFGAYDGMRLFLWCIPYFCIIPSLIIYLLIKNLKKKIFKFFFYVNILLFFLYLISFFAITPYHYTYLNLFNGSNLKKISRFEGDYWNVSIKELVKKVDFDKYDEFKLATCGINRDILKKHLMIYQKEYLKKINFVDIKNANYLLMVNRVASDIGNSSDAYNIDTCFNKFKGNQIVKVERLGYTISSIIVLNR